MFVFWQQIRSPSLPLLPFITVPLSLENEYGKPNN